MTFSSAVYWEQRYLSGGTSGAGSEGENAEWKASFLNDFVVNNNIVSVIEFGCGDGRQLALARYPSYVGVEVSPTALGKCRKAFANDRGKRFVASRPDGLFDLSLSLDVIYHLPEDDVYEQHMADVFAASREWVVLYTTDSDRLGVEVCSAHVRHRPIRVVEGWELLGVTLNPRPDLGGCDFYVYRRNP